MSLVGHPVVCKGCYKPIWNCICGLSNSANVINIEDYNMTLQEKIDKTFDSGVELIINSKNLADGVTFIEAMDVLSAFVKFAEDIIDLPQSGKYKSEVVVKL